jgi:hypothetical protein
VGPNGNNLTRTAATTGQLDAGAVSTQWITRGDAYVEFSANENNLSHVVGLSEIPAACVFPCHDQDPSIATLDYAVSLNVNGRVFILERGNLINGPGAGGSWGTYAAGERFRVTVADNNDANGTARITYSRIQGLCAPGNLCAETPIRTSTRTAHYRLRVDTSFREVDATVTDVRLVRVR